MKLPIDKEWFEMRAAAEGDLEIGVGRRREYPPAYGGCGCPCHHSPMLHVVACCHPGSDDKAALNLLANLKPKGSSE